MEDFRNKSEFVSPLTLSNSLPPVPVEQKLIYIGITQDSSIKYKPTFIESHQPVQLYTNNMMNIPIDFIDTAKYWKQGRGEQSSTEIITLEEEFDSIDRELLGLPPIPILSQELDIKDQNMHKIKYIYIYIYLLD